jgi:hypothetical protein
MRMVKFPSKADRCRSLRFEYELGRSHYVE